MYMCDFCRSLSGESWYILDTLQHTATHCNTLQHTATQCNTLQHSATHCNTLQDTGTHCNTLQHNATHWINNIKPMEESVMKAFHTATHCDTMQHTAPRRQSNLMWRCNTLQRTAPHCNTLQHTATHCNTLQHTTGPGGQHTKTVDSTKVIESCQLTVMRYTALTCQLFLKPSRVPQAPRLCSNLNVFYVYIDVYMYHVYIYLYTYIYI